MTREAIWYDDMHTPIGVLRLVADDAGLREVWFSTGKHQRTPRAEWMRDEGRLAFARTQLNEYFAGTRQRFELPLHPVGTSFQQEVWWALANIPYGETISYGELARRIGHPQAVRASSP